MRQSDHIELSTVGLEFVEEPGVVLIGIVDVDNHLSVREHGFDSVIACRGEGGIV